MAENTMSANVPFGSGYKCWNCGMWVPNGTLHTCGNQAQPAQPVVYQDPAQTRIALALERIAAALEASREPTGGTQHAE